MNMGYANALGVRTFQEGGTQIVLVIAYTAIKKQVGLIQFSIKPFFCLNSLNGLIEPIL